MLSQSLTALATVPSSPGRLPMIRAASLGVIVSLGLFAAGESRAEAPRAGIEATSKTSRLARLTAPSHKLRESLDSACLRIDPISGNRIPCKPPSSSSYNDGRSSGSLTVPQYWVPFDEFDATYSQEDFLSDPESVLPNAYLLSQLSAISYRNPGYAHDVINIVENTDGAQAYGLAQGLGLQSEDIIERQGASFFDLGDPGGHSTAYVFHNADVVVVAFRGSTSDHGAQDWIDTNPDIWPMYKPNWGKVSHTKCLFGICHTWDTDIVTIHHGMYDAMDLIYDEVLETIVPLLADGRELWLTGHSLGGAVAILTAFRLEHDDNIPVQGVHMFGAPAVGDDDWAQQAESTLRNVHRWSAEGDPAPVVTQAPMFYHVGFVNNLFTDGEVELDSADMFGYAPHCAPGYGLQVAHMSYWSRMHGVLEDYYPELADVLPPPLQGEESFFNVPDNC